MDGNCCYYGRNHLVGAAYMTDFERNHVKRWCWPHLFNGNSVLLAWKTLQRVFSPLLPALERRCERVLWCCMGNIRMCPVLSMERTCPGVLFWRETRCQFWKDKEKIQCCQCQVCASKFPCVQCWVTWHSSPIHSYLCCQALLWEKNTLPWVFRCWFVHELHELGAGNFLGTQFVHLWCMCIFH
jgi:hypothetical protein